MFLTAKNSFSIALCGLTTVFSSLTWATGTFTATQACETYLSTKKLNNPDGFKLEIGKTYTFVKSNKHKAPQWYLLRLEGVEASIADRWVKTDCGNIVANNDTTTATTANSNKSGKSCSLANEADGYVFAVSWQPAFCETKPDKNECKINNPKVYQATHFTLHGLWPNKTRCGTNYGYCGEVKDKPKDFCDYPNVSLSAKVKDKLALVMPSVSAGSCLERHEWHKHGTCQTGTPDQYYDLAVKLVHQFNDSGISFYMREHIGKKVTLNEFQGVLDKSLGGGASSRAKLICKNGMLVDVYLNLPAQISPDARLSDLLAKAPVAKNDKSCAPRFRIDPIGQGK